jgi:P27 family predicted phage terminase small subunit
MKGRKPKPASQQISEGDPRKRGVHKLAARLESEPRPAHGLRACPKHLTGRARLAWRFWRKELERMNLDCRPDALTLEGACMLYATASDMHELIEQQGKLVAKKERNPRTGQLEVVDVRAHPGLAIRDRALALLRGFCAEFGLSPVSRARLTVDRREDDTDDLMALLAGPRETEAGETGGDSVKEMQMLIEMWSTDRPIEYARNARKITKAAVDKVAASIQEFGFRQPIVVDVDGVIIVGHVRLRGAKKLGLAQVPVHVATNLTPAQVKAYRLMDNRSHEEVEWDFEMLGAELLELKDMDVEMALTGFNARELDTLLVDQALDEKANEVPPVPVVAVTQADDLWLLGSHRVLCADCTNPESVARLLGDRKPLIMITDPPYGIELDSEWRDRAGLNGCGPAESSYMKHRTEGHTETTISGDTRADWSEAFELVPSLQIAYVWHASIFTREVLNGLLRIGFLYPQQIIWNKGRTVLTRTHYWYQHEPCWYVRKKNAPWFGKPGENSTIWDAASPKFIMGGSKEEKFDHPTQKPVELMRRSILNHTNVGELVYEPFLGSGTTLAAAEVTQRACCGTEIDPKYVDVVVQRWQNLSGLPATLDGSGATFEQVKHGRRLGAEEGIKEECLELLAERSH